MTRRPASAMTMYYDRPMRLETTFAVAAPPEQTWRHLLDVATLAQCVPSFELRPPVANGVHAGELTIVHNGTSVRGLGRLRAIDADVDKRTASIGIEGRELAGPALASGLLTASVVDESGASRVLLSADVDLAGHRAPADTVLADGQRLLDDFAAALGRRMVEHPAATDGPQPAAPAAPAAAAGARAASEPEVLDLGSVLGERLFARYGALGVSLVALSILVWMALRKPRR
jgi:carbon monoxide dehydrogenase subunit G